MDKNKVLIGVVIIVAVVLCLWGKTFFQEGKNGVVQDVGEGKIVSDREDEAKGEGAGGVEGAGGNQELAVEAISGKYSGNAWGINKHGSFMVVQFNIEGVGVRYVEVGLNTAVFDADSAMIFNPMNLEEGHDIIVYKADSGSLKDNKDVFKTGSMVVGNRGDVIDVRDVGDEYISGVVGNEVVKVYYNSSTKITDSFTGYDMDISEIGVRSKVFFVGKKIEADGQNRLDCVSFNAVLMSACNQE